MDHPEKQSSETDNPVVLYDGVCNFCSGVVKFVIKRDKKGLFRFASLQSATGKKLLGQYGIDATRLDTFVLVYKGKARTRSTGALWLLKMLGMPWNLAFAFVIIPAPIRNAIYNLVAHNRYKWFGKKDSCMVPTPEIRGRFLDWGEV